MLHKKGISMVMVGLIATVLIMALLIYFVGFVYKPAVESSLEKQICKDSVLLKAKAKKIPLLQAEAKIDLHCNTTKIAINSLDQLNTEGKGLIANAMYDCWDQFGEGKVDFLDRYSFRYQKTFCFICSKIEFDKSIAGNKFDINLLTSYLNEQYIPSTDMKYSEYFFNTKNTKVDVPEFKVLTIDKPLYVVFYATQERSLVEMLGAIGTGGVLGLTGGCLVGLVIPVPGTFAIGCSIGGKLGLALGGTKAIGTLTEYYPGLYLSNSEEDIIKTCNK